MKDEAVEVLEKVLEAFNKRPRMCMHVLHESTELPYHVIRPALMHLSRKHKITSRVGMGKADRIYELVDKPIEVPQFVDEEEPRLPPILGLTEDEARSRVHMLRRMKGSLISEWHPVLDVLLRDYQQGLESIDRLRFPLERDELERV